MKTMTPKDEEFFRSIGENPEEIMNCDISDSILDVTKDYRRTIKDWKVDENGNLCYYQNGVLRYCIEKSRLAEPEWVSHMKTKAFVKFEDFYPAYFKACEMAGIRELNIKLFRWNDSFKFED